jgi:hypothetical protein
MQWGYHVERWYSDLNTKRAHVACASAFCGAPFEEEAKLRMFLYAVGNCARWKRLTVWTIKQTDTGRT